MEEGSRKLPLGNQMEEMNINNKMSRYGQKLIKKVWWKDLLMTFIGITFSIVLTFGTAAWMDNSKKKINGTIIHTAEFHSTIEGIVSSKLLNIP